MKKIVTYPDWQKLQSVLDALWDSPVAPLLEDFLASVTVTDAERAAPDLVTMRSRITWCDDQIPAEKSEQHELTLVYPGEEDIDQGKVSVVAPIGLAMLGATVGSSVSWRGNDGRKRSAKIAALLYQPEAEGHWHL